MTAACPALLRTRTVTAPQGLFLMNSDEVEKATDKFAERLRKEAGSDLGAAIDLGYRIAARTAPVRRGERDRGADLPGKRSGAAQRLCLAAV